ncbi:MAG: hypothetical protein C4547_00745 [Phycisphaerales bacterium]|nr:MAG: hypothetical protein C4547_00745 [Phycisphaerales bacterium]
MADMLTVTDEALERLSRKLSDKKAETDMALRFERAEGGWRLNLDRARPNDASFSYQGRKVLLLDSQACAATSSLTLNVQRKKSGPRLRLTRVSRPKG